MKVIKRIRGQKLPENTVYVGRPSKWGNPFKVGEAFTAKEAVCYYQEELDTQRILGTHSFMPLLDLTELKGKNLACWCGEWEIGEPEIDCHAVILMKAANDL